MFSSLSEIFAWMLRNNFLFIGKKELQNTKQTPKNKFLNVRRENHGLRRGQHLHEP